jgi:HlyD family secretion protein
VKAKIGGDARIVLDIAPEYAARAKVTFVAPEAQFTPKQVETRSERDKLMFRVKLSVPPERVLPYIERVKTGIRGVGYVRLDDSTSWPVYLDRELPKRGPAATDATASQPNGKVESAPQDAAPTAPVSEPPAEKVAAPAPPAEKAVAPALTPPADKAVVPPTASETAPRS